MFVVGPGDLGNESGLKGKFQWIQPLRETREIRRPRAAPPRKPLKTEFVQSPPELKPGQRRADRSSAPLPRTARLPQWSTSRTT